MHRTTAWGLKAVLVALGAFLAAASSPSLLGAGPVDRGGSAADPRLASSGAERGAHRGATAAPVKAAASKPKRTHDASQTSISGTVTDGSGHGWPLYAMLEFTSDSTEPLEVYSDPVTGQYQASLFDGIAYSVAVASLEGGYRPAGGTLTADGTPLVRDWTLAVDAYACQAPGYQANGVDAILSEGFDAGVLPAGWSIDTFSGASWKIWDAADPCGAFPGNDTGGTGPFALLNSNCDSDHLNFDDSSLVTPSLDLTGLSSAALLWNNEYRFFFSTADVDVSTDGGGSWTNLWERIGIYEWGPQVQSVDLSPFVGQAGVLVRFHYRGFNSWWWQVDNVIVGQPLCSPVAGGLVVGNVLDANTGAGVNGATVSSATDVATTTSFDPGDPSHGAGFFYLFQPAGPQMLEASSQAYSPDSQTVTVFNNDAVRRDFALQAGRLDASPRPVVVAIPPDGLAMKTLTVTNSGAVDASFQLIELNTPLLASTTAGFASGATRDQSLARLPKDEKGRPVTNARSAAGLAGFSTSPLEHPTAPHVAAGGTVIGAFPTGITYAWGVGAFGTDVWLSNIAVAGGDNLDYQYTGDGVRTGQTIDDNAFLTGGDWAADGAFNSRTGTIWRVKVGEGENGENCLHEIDPTTKTVTGNT
ncbi:MAG TPA: hypothetical protein VMN82_06750, partial [Thermoanaerobaculia bacterium]|nr:hypothetical protein [Thermoanaerobaculia bacterium]